MCCREKLRLTCGAVTLAVLWCVGAVAQPPLTITSGGYFITQVDAAGIPTMVQITTVIDMTGGNTPLPPGGDKPDVDAVLVKQVQGWADVADEPQTAQAIAAVYSHVRGAVEDGLLNGTTVWPALKTATDVAIETTEGTEVWTVFRDSLSSVVTEGRQRGTLQTPADIARMLRSVQHGLELSADGSDAVSLDKLVAIAAKVNEAIDGQK